MKIRPSRLIAPTSVVLAVTLMGACAKEDPAYKQLSFARCQGNICLAYRLLLEDKDRDGIGDIDELALRTNPSNAKNVPDALMLAKLVGQGRLDSFNRGFSEVIVLPTKGPGGKDLVSSDVARTRQATLDAMGISSDVLAAFGIQIGDGFTVAHALPIADRKGGDPSAPSAPPIMIGGVNMAWYSDDENGMPKEASCTGCSNPDSQTVHQPANQSGFDVLWNFLTGKSGSGDKPGGADGGTPPKNSPDGGAAGMTDPDAGSGVVVVTLSPEEFQRVWFKAKGGQVSRTVNGDDLPSPAAGGKPVIGRDPYGPIVLIDPDQAPANPRNRLIVFPPPAFLDPHNKNTNFGPRLIGGVKSATGVPLP